MVGLIDFDNALLLFLRQFGQIAIPSSSSPLRDFCPETAENADSSSLVSPNEACLAMATPLHPGEPVETTDPLNVGDIGSFQNFQFPHYPSSSHERKGIKVAYNRPECSVM